MTEEPNLADQVITAFGGPTKMSKATGWPISTIDGWGTCGRIPRWRRQGIKAAAEREGVTLPQDFLALCDREAA